MDGALGTRALPVVGAATTLVVVLALGTRKARAVLLTAHDESALPQTHRGASERVNEGRNSEIDIDIPEVYPSRQPTTTIAFKVQRERYIYIYVSTM